jgi:hypothetical protein
MTPVRLMLLLSNPNLTPDGAFHGSLGSFTAIGGATNTVTTAADAGITDAGTGGIAKTVSNGSGSGLGRAISTVAGRRYVIRASCYGVAFASATINVGTTSGATNISTSQPWIASAGAWDTRDVEFTATTSSTHITFCASQSVGRTAYFDNISVKRR